MGINVVRRKSVAKHLYDTSFMKGLMEDSQRAWEREEDKQIKEALRQIAIGSTDMLILLVKKEENE